MRYAERVEVGNARAAGGCDGIGNAGVRERARNLDGAALDAARSQCRKYLEDLHRGGL